MQSLPRPFDAVVIGATGGIGSAVARTLRDIPGATVHAVGRRSEPTVDVTDEASIADLAERVRNTPGDLRLIFDATGVLEIDGKGPEKSLSAIDPASMAKAFAINAIGPALLIKHLTPLLARDGKTVFASLSARVGSIGDNDLGGWISYRASKAGLNQIVHTAAIELTRKRPDSVCVALHPGTVPSRLTERYAGGRYTFDADKAAQKLLAVLDGIGPDQSGGFFAYDGSPIPW